MSAQDEPASNAVHDLLQRLVADGKLEVGDSGKTGAMVTHWTMVAETIEPDGEVAWMMLTAPGDHLAHYLQHARMLEIDADRQFRGYLDDAED